MEKIKKLDILKIVFIIYCIILIGNGMFVRPKTDNAFGTSLLIAEVWAAMPMEQLGLIIGVSLIVMIVIIVAIVKSNEEKIISKKIIIYLIMLIINIIIICVSSIYVYHNYKFTVEVTTQTQMCIDDLKDNSKSPSQININKIKTSTDYKEKYRYITLDYSTNKERKIVIYKLDNKENKILKQYEVDNIEYVTSIKGFFAVDNQLDIDVKKLK